MAVTETTPPETEAEAQSPAPRQGGPGELERLIGTGDHTTIGRMFIGCALALLVAAVLVKVLTGVDTATDNGFLGAYYDMLSLSSLVALVFLGVLPLLLGLAIHTVPLQIGSPSIAFPRAAALSLWTWLVSSAIFLISMAFDGGVGGGDLDGSRLGNIALGAVMASLALGAVCVATTVVSHRPAGMGLARVPLFAWSMLVASSIWIVTLGSAIAHSIIGHIGPETSGGILENFSTGIAWLLRGPAVYMLAIPVLGIAGDVIATVTRRPLRNYGVFQAMIAVFGVLAFGAWAQSPDSINTPLWMLWALAIGLPVLGMLGGLAETLRHGKVRPDAALVGSLLALVNVLAAVVVGLLIALDTAGTGTLFDFEPVELVQAQAIFVVTAAVAGALAGLAHWSTKVWGSRARSPLALASIVLVDLGGGLWATVLAVQVFVQAGGDDTADALFGVLIALGAVLVLVGLVGAVVSYVGSDADDDVEAEDSSDESGLTLEWQTPSPAIGGVRMADLPEITSPYPLVDPAMAASEEGN